MELFKIILTVIGVGAGILAFSFVFGLEAGAVFTFLFFGYIAWGLINR